MALTSFNPAVFNPFMLWADVAVKTTEMLVSSGQVIGTRVGRMARAGANPSARDRREMALMGSEKVKAATASGLAVAARLQAANWQLYARAWEPHLQRRGAPRERRAQARACGVHRECAAACARANAFKVETLIGTAMTNPQHCPKD